MPTNENIFVEQSSTNIVVDVDAGTFATTDITVNSVPPFIPQMTPNGVYVFCPTTTTDVIYIVTATQTAGIVSTSATAGSLAVVNVTPDGNTLVAAGGSAPNDQITTIDITTLTAIGTISTGGTGSYSNNDFCLTNDGAYAYLAGFNGNLVTVVEIATLSVLTTIPIANGPFSCVPDPNGLYIYALNQNTASVSVIQISTNTVIDTITTGMTGFPLYGVISPNGSTLYVENGDGIIVIDLGTRTVTTVVAPSTSANAPFCIDPSGAYVCFTGTVSPVYFLETAGNTLVNTYSTGNAVFQTVASLDGSVFYVAGEGPSVLYVFDVATQALLDTISVGGSPKYLTAGYIGYLPKTSEQIVMIT